MGLLMLWRLLLLTLGRHQPSEATTHDIHCHGAGCARRHDGHARLTTEVQKPDMMADRLVDTNAPGGLKAQQCMPVHSKNAKLLQRHVLMPAT